VPPHRVKVEDLPPCMNTCIRPPACMGPHRRSQHLGKPSLDGILDGASARLALPPGEPGSIIRADALPAVWHGSDYSNPGSRDEPWSRKSWRMSVAALESMMPLARTPRRSFLSIVDSAS